MYLTTRETAEALGISPSTLRRWSMAFAYPRSRAVRGEHRMFLRSDVLALRAALGGGHSIGAAVGIAKLLPQARDEEDREASGE